MQYKLTWEREECCGNCLPHPKPTFKPLPQKFLAAIRESEDFQRTVAAILSAEKHTCPLCGSELHDEGGVRNSFCGKCQNFVEVGESDT